MLAMPDYAAGVHEQKSWEVNISGRAILTLILKKIKMSHNQVVVVLYSFL